MFQRALSIRIAALGETHADRGLSSGQWHPSPGSSPIGSREPASSHFFEPQDPYSPQDPPEIGGRRGGGQPAAFS